MDNLLRAERVAFVYPQHGRGLSPTSLQLAAGEIVHVSSPSGAGKSTLARCLSGLIPHLYHGRMEGAVWVAGQRTDQTPLWQIAESTGIVFQNPASQMMAATVEEELIFGLENLGLPADEIDRRVEQALQSFDLAAMRQRAPLTLSGGEQQKLALAAVMARRPAVLVLDEPLSMLDTTSAFDLVARLGQVAGQGTAIVICEHRHEYLAGLPGLRLLELDHTEAAQPPAGPPPQATIPQAPRPTLPVLRLETRGLHVVRGGKTILDGWNLGFAGGQITAIVGRNGVGKTTLLRTLAGLQAYQGQMVLQAGSQAGTPHLGIVFQNPDLQLFNASVREEILYGLKQPDQKHYTWLVDALDLQCYEDTPPLLLSEGEKRRVALATILMRQSEHGILLDEPALGQDSDHKDMLVRLLRTLAAAGQIVVYATHDVDLAMRADQLVLLGPHGIIAAGTPQSQACQASAWQQAGLRLPEWVIQTC